MKSVFEKETRDEVIYRINSLNEKSLALWGKMNIYQMLAHNAMWQQLMLGKVKSKRVFMGRIFGKAALKNALKDESPLRKNTPTTPEVMAREKSGDLEMQRKKWIKELEEYANYSSTEFVHPFFGKMTRQEVGYFVYKHSDHHLRQFGV
ncbi:MAG TPA: DinB family protein [Hanamia sp.]|nr:DinB family protein [Hanamia sp.]